MDEPSEELCELYQRWVNPLYLRLLHGNFRGSLLAQELSPEREALILDFRQRLAEVEPAVVTTLLEQQEWRAKLTAGWYAGLKGWRQFRDEFGRQLIESGWSYSDQGFCAALACFADEASAGHLCEYLEQWSPERDHFRHQHWALPALVWIDRSLGSQHAAKYLVPGGLWDQWSADKKQRAGLATYQEAQRRFDLTLSSALAAFRS